MANSSNALVGFQTSVDLRLFDLSTNSQQNNDYRWACYWARQFAISMECKDIPPKPVINRDSRVAIEQWMDHFELLMDSGLMGFRAKVARIRKSYENRGGIPRIEKMATVTA